MPEPVITFDPDLPISARVDDIAAAISEHQVVVVAGETGSGKTTQLPKICLQLGRTRIAHTQPRRIAARSVAERIAEELGVALGDLVGYQVRFTTRASRATQLKVMTDGVLLNETGFDRDLARYDTIIIDEAHERSLNIDFLLGYLKQLLVRRPDLKVIITSATIDTARFSEHFDGAPIIEVSGRTYPVEIRYRPVYDDTAEHTPVDPDRDQVDAICDAVTELFTEPAWGDILVFLSGEREIRDTATALQALKLPHTEILPLYARLSAAEQHKVFAPHTSHGGGTGPRGRRVVLSTNVAETSLTVPGIRYVVDAGTARISRYSARTKVQRLPIEPISQASANQRSGRCGRTAPGVAIRLYSEEDFAGRPEFTEPEILRTNLASVILQMAQAKLGEIGRFPFVEAPDTAQIRDGLRLLTELGAIRSENGPVRLTAIGRRLARIPLDPRMGRMLIEAEQRHCLREVTAIVAGMSIQDPRERPRESAEKADALHRRFWAPLPEGGSDVVSTGSTGVRGSTGVVPRDSTDGKGDEGSDFLAWWRLWEYLTERQESLSGNAFRRLCRDEFLHYLRIREWQDLHTQLRQITRELGMQRNRQPADAATIHTSILSGLLSHIGLADLREDAASARGSQRGNRSRDRRRPLQEYLGARGARFAIQPGSVVAKQPPPLVMAAELVETTRLWARTVTGIDAEWVEAVGEHLLKRQYSEPHWSSRRQAVVAYETVSVYGVPIISQRVVNYGRINPAEAREIFLRSALVEGDWRTRHPFWQHNQQVRQEAAELEERTRRRDILVDDETIFAFYDARIPADVVSAAHFDSWWRRASRDDEHALDLTLADLVHDDADEVSAGDFPDHWTVPTDHGPVDLPLQYVFEPGSGRDGVSVTIPLALVNQLDAAPFTWQVPGLRTELATELIRSLPKQLRTRFVPAPDQARGALEWLSQQGIGPDDRGLPDALAHALQQRTGAVATIDGRPAFDAGKLPGHLRTTFVITDSGRTVAEGSDLAELTEQLRPRLTRTLNKAARQVTRTGVTDWQFGHIATQVELKQGNRTVVGYPALVDEGATVGLAIHDQPERAVAAARAGLRRLVTLNTPDPTKWVIAHLSNHDRIALASSPYDGVPALLADARLASVGSLLDELVPQPRDIADAGAFVATCDRVRADNADRMRSVVSVTAETLRRLATARAGLPSVRDDDARADLTEQLGNLVFAGHLSATPYRRLVEVPRYLEAARIRIETLHTTPAKDAAPFDTILGVEDAYADLCSVVPPGPLPSAVADIGWMLEELRVSLFAQRLGTRGPVSAKRVMNAIGQARRELALS